ncbi:hypothetical protein ASD04_11295 [Devosia sp. Root436]|nr:hypothetical protein ASD04_11295 [Devosia sp. Root436]
MAAWEARNAPGQLLQVLYHRVIAPCPTGIKPLTVRARDALPALANDFAVEYDLVWQVEWIELQK